MDRKRSRVSAGVGRRAPREHTESSTTRENKAPSGFMICTGCGAEYHDKRWHVIDTSLSRPAGLEVEKGLCPGCHRVDNKIVEGLVVLEVGSMKPERLRELLSLVKHVETECWQENPASRMVRCAEGEGRIEIDTTTTWLATRLGKSIDKAFKGRLDIKPSPAEETVYVHWSFGQEGAK